MLDVHPDGADIQVVLWCKPDEGGDDWTCRDSDARDQSRLFEDLHVLNLPRELPPRKLPLQRPRPPCALPLPPLHQSIAPDKMMASNFVPDSYIQLLVQHCSLHNCIVGVPSEKLEAKLLSPLQCFKGCVKGLHSYACLHAIAEDVSKPK